MFNKHLGGQSDKNSPFYEARLSPNLVQLHNPGEADKEAQEAEFPLMPSRKETIYASENTATIVSDPLATHNVL